MKASELGQAWATMTYTDGAAYDPNVVGFTRTLDTWVHPDGAPNSSGGCAIVRDASTPFAGQGTPTLLTVSTFSISAWLSTSRFLTAGESVTASISDGNGQQFTLSLRRGVLAHATTSNQYGTNIALNVVDSDTTYSSILVTAWNAPQQITGYVRSIGLHSPLDVTVVLGIQEMFPAAGVTGSNGSSAQASPVLTHHVRNQVVTFAP